MKRFSGVITGIIVTLTLLLMPLKAFADAPALVAPPGLSFAEIKITGDEFVVLQNNTGAVIPDLSTYWLQDFNNPNPLAAGVSNSSQQLPAVSLDAGDTVMLSSTTRDTCGAEVAGKLSVSLTDAGGFLEVVQMATDAGGGVDQTAGDAVSWSSGTGAIIPSVPTTAKDPFSVNGLYYRTVGTAAGSFAWQQGGFSTTDACQLEIGTTAVPQPTPSGSLSQSDDSPPATIVSLASSDDGPVAPTMPAADLGLKAPQLTEILPNPSGTGTDDTDEFIELYNPNATNFDLSGFVLQTGTTAKHNYTFPAGTMLTAKSFEAFYSADTGLSLSNSGGQVTLLDPLGNTIGQTGTYGIAKDGEAWALAGGNWYWTLSPTPGAINNVNQAAATTSSSKSSSTKASASGSVKGASTGSTGSSSGGTGDTSDVAQVTPIHPWALAVVALSRYYTGCMSTEQTWQTASTSLENTEKLAASLGAKLRGGEVIELISDLGGGKTAFVRGLAKGMGSPDKVSSPSFTISHVYKTEELTLYHFDFYRLTNPGVVGRELAEILDDPKAVVAVEWANIVENVLPAGKLTIHIQTTGETARDFTFTYPESLNYLIARDT